MKTEKSKRLKGSVLFTVVSVMSLMIIFLMGTLLLASAANKRAHKSYATSQCEYTAKSAIESFMTAMSDSSEAGKGIAGAIQNLSTPLYPEVIISDTSMGYIGCYQGGTFVENRIAVEPVAGSAKYYYDEVEGWVELTTVKISATVRLGGEESTVSAYIRKRAPHEINQAEVKGLQTAGGAKLPNGGTYTGGLGVGIENSDPSLNNYSMTNETTIETELTYINGSLNAATSTFNINVLSPNSETIIMGNLNLSNNKLVNVDYEMTTDFTQKDIPYLYVDGCFSFDSSPNLVAGNSAPYNVFAGTFDSWGKALTLNGADLYLMDSVDGYTYTKANGAVVSKGKNRIGGTSSTALSAWVSSVAQKGETQFDSIGGNIYCNGDLELSDTTIKGDVRVAGNATIGSNVTVDGDLVVGGTLNYDPGMTVTGSIYCDLSQANPPFGTVTVLNDGVVQVENEYVPESWVVKEGYKPIDNNWYAYDEVEINDSWGTWTAYYDKYGHQCWPSDPAAGYYIDSDLYGNDLSEWSTSEPYSYYTEGSILEESVRVDKTEACDYISEHYLRVDSSSVKIEPEEETGDQYSFYDADDNLIAAEDAYHDIGLAIDSSLYGEIYPSSMRREEILGTAGDENKIITTLEEVRESLGYDATTGEFDTTKYAKAVPSGYDTSKDALLKDAWGNYQGMNPDVCDGGGNISENCTLSGNLPISVTIRPTSEIWVVLDNVKLDNKEIIVDESAGGKVNFFINGTLTVNNGCIRPDYITSGTTVKYSDIMNITYYGEENSAIKMTNISLICGAAKAPFTTLDAKNCGPISINYEDEHGNTKSMSPTWIGNALVESVEDAQNNFQLCYTKAGSSSIGFGSKEIGLWGVNYFTQY